MRDFGYNRDNAYKDFERLPLGGYIVKIQAVVFEEGKDGKSDQLRLKVDVCEGEFIDYFKHDYENNTQENKKWRGVITIWCPKNDGSEKDGWTKKTFDTCFAAIEDSNPGFRFNGTDEKSLVGKIVGAVVYREDYRDKNSGAIKTAHKFDKKLVTVDSIRKGTFRTPKDKIIEDTANLPVDKDGFMSIPSGSNDAELPF